MASFTDYLTSEGERMLAKAMAGQKISFTKIVIGSGYLPSGAIERNVNAVVVPEKEIPIASVSVNASDSVLVSAHFSNKEIEHGFYFREKAIYMSDGRDEVLGIYGNNSSEAEYIDTTDVCIVEKTIKSVVKLSTQELANINIVDDEYEFAPVMEPSIKTINDFVKTNAALAVRVGQRVIINKRVAYTYIGDDPADASCYITGANVLSDVYEEKLADGSAEGGIGASQNALFNVYGVASRAIEGITTHLKDKDNPHGVTKKQVGLENVPNVTTNDQTPTYTEAKELATLKSGEKLSVAFGKIMKAISSLISHLNNKDNPHEVTKDTVELGNVPNVTTNDQTPTYTEAEELTTLKSGEKLSVSFGKIMKAITELIGIKKSVERLDVTDAEFAILGAKVDNSTCLNLIPFPYYDKNVTRNGITFTPNDDGSVTVNGTATAVTQFNIIPRTKDNSFFRDIGTRTITISNASEDITNIGKISLQAGTKEAYYKSIGVCNGNPVTLSIDETLYDYNAQIQIAINKGVSVKDFVFKPMLEVGSQAHDYVPPLKNAKNRLNEVVADNSRSISNIVGTDVYNSTTSYSVGNTCISDNQPYECIVECSGVKPPNTEYWIPFSLDSLQRRLTYGTSEPSASSGSEGDIYIKIID